MAIVNRDKDASEQKDVVHVQIGANSGQGTVVGVSQIVWMFKAPAPCAIQSIGAAPIGLSGSPALDFQIARYVDGFTAFSVGTTFLTLGATFGGAGAVGHSFLAATGSTLLQMGQGDVLRVVTSVANSAMTNVMVDVVVKKTQDIVAYNGIQS